MKTIIPFRITNPFLIGVSLTLAFFFAVPRAPASDSPRAAFLKNLLGEVEEPETSFPGVTRPMELARCKISPPGCGTPRLETERSTRTRRGAQTTPSV